MEKIKNKISLTQLHLLLMGVLLLCIFQYGITKIYGMYLFPDEFGYWASAATALGYDWSEVAALGAYYSFGYSAILLPILRLVENATDAYRVAVFINMLLLGSCLLLLFHNLKFLFKELDTKMIAFMSGIAVFFPSCIYYMQMTLTESLLTFLFVAVATILLHYFENPRGLTAVCLAVLLCYLYFVHMRTVGILIAVCITMLLAAASHSKYRKSFLIFLISMVVLAACGLGLKQLLTENLYHSMAADSLAANNYAGQVGKIKALFSIRGIKQLLISCVGKLFYLGSATFGLFYWAIGFLIERIVELVKRVRKKEAIPKHSMWYVFLLLAVFLHFGVTALYHMENGQNGRIDALLYGRYNEILVPLLLGIGLIAMFRSRHLLRNTLVIVAIQGAFAPLLYYYIRARELTQLYTCHIAAIRYAVNAADFHIEEFIGITFLISSLLGISITGIIVCIRKKQEFYWLLGILMAVEIFLGVSASAKDIYVHNEDNYRDHQMAEEIAALDRQENEITYLYPGGTTYVDLLQFYLRDTKFTVMNAADYRESLLEEDDLVLIDAEDSHAETLDKQYDSRLESGHFLLYYNKAAGN